MKKSNTLHKIRKAVETHSILLLQLSLGIIFLWFGMLKFLDASPAEAIASKTMSLLTFGLLKPEVSVPLLAAVECIIGIGIITRKFLNYITPILYLQMAGTLLPLFLFPKLTWQAFLVPTLEGQYIIKNMVLIAAAITLNAVEKGRLREKDV